MTQYLGPCIVIACVAIAGFPLARRGIDLMVGILARRDDLNMPQGGCHAAGRKR